MGQDVPPAVEQLPGPYRVLAGSLRGFLAIANRGDAERREQVAERICYHRGGGAEQADCRSAEGRADRNGAPVRGLEPRVRHEQVSRPDNALEVGAAGRVEGDL